MQATYEWARERGLVVGLRGTGCSYGDASVNEGGCTLDLTRMNRVLDWDPETGVANLEAGATVERSDAAAFGLSWRRAAIYLHGSPSRYFHSRAFP